MKLWERFLYAGALLSGVFLLFIFSAHRSNGSQAHAKMPELSRSFATLSPYASGGEKIQSNDADVENETSSDVSPQDAMHIIDGYYRIQSQHKELAEEEERLLEQVDDAKVAPRKKENPPAKDTFRVVEYKVQKGDSLWSIARKYDVSVLTVSSANAAVKNKMIYVGQSIRVPNQDGLMVQVQKGNSLAQIAAKYKSNTHKIKKYNGLDGNEIFAKQELFLPDATPLPQVHYKKIKMFQMPLQGRITSGYGYRIHPVYKTRAFHYGIDISAVSGTPIKAASDGVVIFAGDGGTYGNLIILKHKYNYITLYAHCSTLDKKEGDYVKQGETIATVGNTGVSTGSHLHFEVKQNRKSINPLLALKQTLEIAAK